MSARSLPLPSPMCEEEQEFLSYHICRYIDAGCDVLLTNTYHANIATMKATRKMTDAEAEAVVAVSPFLL